jgi:hypothetical protein
LRRELQGHIQFEGAVHVNGQAGLAVLPRKRSGSCCVRFGEWLVRCWTPTPPGPRERWGEQVQGGRGTRSVSVCTSERIVLARKMEGTPCRARGAKPLKLGEGGNENKAGSK